jgi:hypothetical protein
LTSFCQFVRPATALTVPFENKTVAVATKTLKRCLLFAAFVGAPIAIYAQGVDAIVEVPTTAHRSALIEIPTAQNPTASSDNNIPMAGEYKSTKNVVEQEKPVFWTWYADVGYESEYNFRGTNLTPNADGAVFGDVRVTKWNFTLGLFGIHQLGDASVNSWSVGEGGGAASAAAASGTCGGNCPPVVAYARFPTTIQTRFDELDVFLSYKLSLGPIDVTIGDIGFFISRRAETFEKDVWLLPNVTWNIPDTDTRFRFVGPNPTVQNEQFDRVYITLSTTKLSKYIRPQITYYQTLYSAGQEPEAENVILYKPVFVDEFFPLHGPGLPPGFFRPQNPRPNDERNEALGGYLEGRLNGSFPITKWLDFNPYTILSVSFRDRTEPGGTSAETVGLFSNHPNRAASGVYGAHPLTGWNHFQAGVELPIHLVHLGGYSSERWAPPDAHVYLVPTGAYSYHISNPTPGTDRNEWWGGAKVEVTF